MRATNKTWARPLTVCAFALVFSLVMQPLLAPPAAADVVHLRTGEAIKGRAIQEDSDEQKLIIIDYKTGARRSLSWQAVDPADRDRIQDEWGWKNKSQRTISGHRVTQKFSNGSTDDLLGLVESGWKDGSFTGGPVKLRRRGQVLDIPVDQIVEVTDEEMDPRDIWTPEQLYDQFLDELRADSKVNVDDMDSRTHFRAAQYAEWAEALEIALKHYQTCAADPDFLQAGVAKDRAARVESLLRDQEALATIRDIKMRLAMNNFRKCKELLDTFGEVHADASEAVMSRVERLRNEFTKKRTEYFQQEAKRAFVKICEKMIEKKVKEKDIGLTDATAWTRKQLPEDAFKALAERMGKRDDVTPEEAQTFWDGRKKRQWTNRSYGAGTFIVKPPQIKPPSSKPRGGGGNRQGGGGAAPRIKIPKPPTRDQWWAKAKSKERASWVMAYFAQNSGLFEVGDPKFSPCKLCHGAGLLHKQMQTGATLSYLCIRCGGAQQDMKVHFR